MKKKTIAISRGNIGRFVCLEQIMTDATNRRYVISKSTIVFNSKKEAQDTFKALPRTISQGVKLITLNDKQASLINTIKTAEKKYYFNLDRFLNIK